MHCRPTVGRSSTEWRPISGVWLPTVLWYNVIDRPSGDQWPIDARWSGNLRPISWCKFLQKVGRLSADRRATISPDASPMTKHLKIGGSVNETFNLRASKKSRRPTNKSEKIGVDVGQQSAEVARFPHFSLAYRRATVGLGNVTVV